MFVALERFVDVVDALGPASVREHCDHNKVDCMGTVWFEGVGSGVITVIAHLTLE